MSRVAGSCAKLCRAWFTAAEFGKAFAMTGSSKATAVPFAAFL